MKSFALILLFIFIVIDLSAAIKILYFFVPRAIEWGKTTTLQCHFDLESDRLYRVSWSKDGRRFFRFSARENHTEVADSVKGVRVDRDKSNQTHLTLLNIDADSDGVYACEVQTKGPAYKTAYSEKKMNVFYLPKDSLRVDGAENSYKHDNFIKIECRSDPSFPATQLKWQINGKDAMRSQVSDLETTTQPNGLKTTSLELAFEANNNYFDQGSLRMTCLGTMTLELDGGNKTIGDFSKSVEILANYRLGSAPSHETEEDEHVYHKPDKTDTNIIVASKDKKKGGGKGKNGATLSRCDACAILITSIFALRFFSLNSISSQ